MLAFINNNQETFLYLDNEGIDEMIHYLSYLKQHKDDISYHLSLKNELDELEDELTPEGFFKVKHVKLINLDNF